MVASGGKSAPSLPPTIKAASKASAVPSANPYSHAHLPLALLNKSSAKTGATWEVYICRPMEDKYEYQWSGSKRSGTNLIYTLVSATDPTQYCQAQFKKTSGNTTAYQKAVISSKHGARFIMSNVVFVEDAKVAYISCPLKIVLDMSKTKIDPVAEASDSAVQPAPIATVAGSVNLATNQFFDLTVLIQEVHEVRVHDNNRSSFVVDIYDGSLDKATGKIKTMPLRIYFDTIPKTNEPASAGQPGESLIALLDEHFLGKSAVSFFCISGAQDDKGKFSFRSTKNTYVAKAIGTKATKLNSDATLHNVQAGDTVAFELQQSKEARDWEAELGNETRCGLLATFSRSATGVPEIDSSETVWQINWVRITEPPEGQSIKSNDGSRIWFSLTLRDESGRIVLYITEQAALKLVNAADADEFEHLHSEHRLRFPFYASVKIMRRPSKPSAAQPGDSFSAGQQENNFDCFIVDAAEQKCEVLSLRSTVLFPMVCPSVDNVLPSMLGMLRFSEHYAMAVEYKTQLVPAELSMMTSKAITGLDMMRPCTRVNVLVRSTKPSLVFDAGASGNKLVTEGVVDYFQPNGPIYSLTSFCTLETVTDFKLDVPRGAKSQCALVNVTAVIHGDPDSAEQPAHATSWLLVDDVQLLSSAEADALAPVMIKMMYFAALGGQISRKRDSEAWSSEDNPAQAKKCRTLGRSPTGPEVPDYLP